MSKKYSISRAQYLSTPGPIKPSSLSTSDVRFCCAFPCKICCTVHVWSCSVLDHAKIFLTSKLSYLLLFFPAPRHKTKTGIAMRWETTYNNSLGSIRLRGQWTGGVRLCSATTSLNYAFTSLNELKLNFWFLIILNMWQHKNGPSLATHSK